MMAGTTLLLTLNSAAIGETYQVAIVLSVVSTHQMVKAGSHVGSFLRRVSQEGLLQLLVQLAAVSLKRQKHQSYGSNHGSPWFNSVDHKKK